MFNFYSLITKYGGWFDCISSKGGYVDGEWEPGQKSVTRCFGAIVSLSESKIYQSGGTLTTQDRNLYMLEPLPASWKDCMVRYGGNQYRIETDSSNGNERFTRVYSYVLKWVSAFDSEETNGKDRP